MDKIKFLMCDTVTIEMRVKEDKQYIYISMDEADGVEYQVNTFEDIGNYVKQYIKDNVSY